MYRRIKRFIEYRIIHVDDSPHRIALGVSMGLFTAFMPFPGLHTITAFFLAMIGRANKAVALLCSWFNNPFTLIPIYLCSYIVGRTLLGVFGISPQTQAGEAAQMLNNTLSSGGGGWFTSSEFWSNAGLLFGSIGFELATGCLILGSVMAVGSYFLFYKTIVVYRSKQAEQRTL